MTDRIEKTLVVPVPREKVWRAFADSAERSKWEAATYEIDPTPGGRIHYSFPDGISNDGVVLEVEPGRLLRHREPHGPGDTEVTIRIQDVDNGTHISITHSGFGTTDDWEGQREATEHAWSQAIADLVVYLERGVVADRFVRGFLDPGVTIRETSAGLEVLKVTPGRFADRAGVRAGDLLLTVGGAAVYTTPELWALMGGRRPGEVLAVEYLRGRQRLVGSGALSNWSDD